MVATVPTSNFNVETVRVGRFTLSLWDVGGQDKLRPYWRHHFTGTQGVIFVVDCSDRARLDKVREELQSVVADDQLDRAAVLVLANKQDLPDAVRPEELAATLKIETICAGKAVHVQGTVATTGDGVDDGLFWLCRHMRPL